MQPLFPYCSDSGGKVRYPTPGDGYRDLAKRGKKSRSNIKTGHYKCRNCGGYHMVTQNIKRKG